MRESKYKHYSDLPLTLTAPEVGEVLGISRAAAYELVRSAGFPHMKIGSRILVPKQPEQADDFIEEHESLYSSAVQFTEDMPEESPRRTTVAPVCRLPRQACPPETGRRSGFPACAGGGIQADAGRSGAGKWPCHA